MAERKFTLGLNKPGMAAQLRENVSQVVRESAVLVSDYLYCFFFRWLPTLFDSCFVISFYSLFEFVFASHV